MGDQMEKYITLLELDKVLELLAKQAVGVEAAELARNLRPCTDKARVQVLLNETDAALQLTARFGTPSFSGLEPISALLNRAKAGGILNLADFLMVAGVLRVIRGLMQWKHRSAEQQTVLDGYFVRLASNKPLEDQIERVVASEDEVADTASTELASLRRKLRRAAQSVREQLDGMIRSQTYRTYLQDAIVTMRGGRYVVPVKAEYRSEVPGLVHDTSSSGATLFIEPMGVVEINNEIRVIKAQEQAEIECILAELSVQVGAFAQELAVGYEAAVQLDLIFAKAHLAYAMKAELPKLSDDYSVVLKQARHPLLAAEIVVPTDVELGKAFDTLVITGPNTGGKTVTLKTLGLFCAMAMCGLLIPAAQGSTVPVFRYLLVDIGDEQSIEQSLSTFSSHMVNLIRILKQANENSLVLLDELGAGTDPVEGAALAVAILEQLRKQGCKIVATTHYAELKEYALQTERVENACCEFDVETLKPTYRLLIGVPGRSNAFAIAKRLGMEQAVIDRAKSLVSVENTKLEKVVRTLEKTRKELDREKADAQALRKQAVQVNQAAQAQKEQLEARMEKELEQARRQASNLVSRTRAQMDALVEEMNHLRRKKDMTEQEKTKLRQGVRALEEFADPVRRKVNEGYVLPRPLRIGDTVLIFDIDKKATVIGLPNNSDCAEVQAGIMKTRVPLSNLRLVEQEKIRLPKGAVAVQASRSKTPAMQELDIRGQTALDALLDVDNFIDAAVMSGVHQLSIIHGKGTGALRTAVQRHLKKHPSVKSYRLGVFGEGESGVTIVELK